MKSLWGRHGGLEGGPALRGIDTMIDSLFCVLAYIYMQKVEYHCGKGGLNREAIEWILRARVRF